MKESRSKAYVASTLLASLLANAAIADVTVSGTVEGQKGSIAVKAGVVDVRMFREGAVVAAGSTNNQGSYSILVRGNNPIDRVTFETQNSDWHPWVMRAMSATRDDARLPVLLMPDNGPLRYDLYIEQLLSYEQLIYLAFSTPDHLKPQDEVARLSRIYRNRLLSMPSTGELKDITREQLLNATKKRKEVLRLYGIRTAADLRHSEWNTTYITGETRMDTIARIDGTSGTNDLVRNGQRLPFGILNNIQINRDGAKVAIIGNWRKRDRTASGYFRWEIDPKSSDTFSGEWGVDPDRGRLGSWNGVLK